MEKRIIDVNRKIRNVLYVFFFDVAFQKFCIIAVMVTFPLAVGISAILAAITRDYSLSTNFISDLGSINYAPYPWLLDYGAMLTAFFLGPPIFFLESKLVSYPSKPSSGQAMLPSRLRLHLGSFMAFSYLLGIIGLFGIGLFSEDRNVMSLHNYSSLLVFGGMAMGSFFAGILILCSKTNFPKFLGGFMLVAPPIFVTLFFLFIQNPIYEWGAMFTIAGELAPVCVILLRELKSKK